MNVNNLFLLMHKNPKLTGNLEFSSNLDWQVLITNEDNISLLIHKKLKHLTEQLTNGDSK